MPQQFTVYHYKHLCTYTHAQCISNENSDSTPLMFFSRFEHDLVILIIKIYYENETFNFCMTEKYCTHIDIQAMCMNF